MSRTPSDPPPRWRTSARAALALAAALGSGNVLACGACVEDAVASTYDHAVVTKAAAAHRVVVFVQVGAPAGIGAAAQRRLERAAAALPGVERGSVRASAMPAALSFALDPARSSPAQALERLRERTRDLGLPLEAVKTLAPS